MMEYCSNDPCETEAVTERNDEPYCHTCAEAYDRGYETAASYISFMVNRGSLRRKGESDDQL